MPVGAPSTAGITQPSPMDARGALTSSPATPPGSRDAPRRAESTLDTPVNRMATGYTYRRPSSHFWQKDRRMSTMATG